MRLRLKKKHLVETGIEPETPKIDGRDVIIKFQNQLDLIAIHYSDNSDRRR